MSSTAAPLLQLGPTADDPHQEGKRRGSRHDRFRVLARSVSNHIGSPIAFFIAVVGVIGWALLGPMFGFSDTWQLVINTTTTIITFLVVFLIQNSQNHDARALHLKLDEVLRALKHARDGLISLEDLPDEEIDRLEEEFRRLRKRNPGAAPR
jgi:low affinity Fe/Cu permease